MPDEDDKTPLERQEDDANEELRRLSDRRGDVVAEAAAALRTERGQDPESEEQAEPPEQEAQADPRNEEETQTGPVDEPETEPEQTAEAGDEPPPEQATPPPEQSYLVQNEAGEHLFRLQVDGAERLMTLPEAQAELQKRVAGDQRLQQAAQLRAQAEQDRKAAQELKAQAENHERTPPETEPTDDETAKIAKSIVVDVLNGDEDAASKKLAEQLTRRRGANPVTPAPSEIVSEAAARATAAVQKSLSDRAQFEEFAKEFPDIVNDPKAFQYADVETEAIVKDHPDWTPLQVMREAGIRVRNFRGETQTKAPPTPTEPDTEANRAQRRRKLQPMPPQGGVAENLTNDPVPRRRIEDVVADMNKQRRGAQAAYV